MDYFTRWTEAFPIKNQEAITVAETLVENVFARFGCPLELHSDQGRNFESDVFKEMCKLMGISKTRTTPLRPQSDRMVERANQTIENMLSMFVSENQKDWDTHIPVLMMAYRSSVHDSTGISPSEMMLGSEINLPIDLLLGKPCEENSNTSSDYAYDLSKKMEVIHDFARDKMLSASDRIKKQYDRHVKEKSYKISDAVWLFNPKRKKGISPKLQCPLKGPFVITEKLSDVTNRIQENPKSKSKVVHHDRLKPYLGKSTTDWFQKFQNINDKACQTDERQRPKRDHNRPKRFGNNIYDQ